jgi:hypothetical protein
MLNVESFEDGLIQWLSWNPVMRMIPTTVWGKRFKIGNLGHFAIEPAHDNEEVDKVKL